jgi:uncharacterized oxidoreductase
MTTKDNTILITGGATGIGLALAEQFLNAGNTVLICGRRADKLQEAKNKFPKLHTKVCDVSKESERVELIDWAVKNFPSFNMLVNNAGIQQAFNLHSTVSSEKVTEEVTINLIAPIHLTSLAAPHLAKQKEAAIVNISSGLGFIPIAMMPVYCATKAALHSFSISSRHQLKNTSVKIFEIIPPIVETELDHGRRSPDVRGISPEETAAQTLKAIEENKFEFAIGKAADLYAAAHSDKSIFAFNGMNR